MAGAGRRRPGWLLRAWLTGPADPLCCRRRQAAVHPPERRHRYSPTLRRAGL